MSDLIYPATHTMLYGDTGVGKSTMAATYPKNILVWCFDGLGKDMPYRKKAKEVSDVQKYEISVGENSGFTIPYRDAVYEDGVIRIEYYHDENPDRPSAYTKYRHRMAIFQDEYDKWQTVVVDSVTMMELYARKVQEKLLNPMQKFARGTDTRQWFSGSTDDLEEMLIQRFAGLPMNVVIVCHIHERQNQISGEILRGVYAPGRLANRNILNANYQEQYYLHTIRDAEGERHHVVQTTNRDGFAAGSQIDAPDPCYPSYESLWERYKNLWIEWNKE